MYLTIFHYDKEDVIFLSQYFDEYCLRFYDLSDDINDFIRQFQVLVKNGYVKKFPVYLLIENGVCVEIDEKENVERKSNLKIPDNIATSYDILFFQNLHDFNVKSSNKKMSRSYLEKLNQILKNLQEIKLSITFTSLQSIEKAIENQNMFIDSFLQ